MLSGRWNEGGWGWAVYVARVGKKACIQCFGWDHEGKTPLLSHRHRWEHIVKMYHKSRGKQWQTTPKNLPRMQCTRDIPVAWLSCGLCPDRPKGWIPIIIIKKYHKSVKCEIFDWDDLAEDGYMFLWKGQWSCGFHNMRGMSWLVSLEWLCFMDSLLCFLLVSVVPVSKESSFHAPLITFHYT